MDRIDYRPIEVIPTCDARAGWSRRDNGPAFCRGTRGLRSFRDFQGNRRYFCPALGHRSSVARLYGEAPFEWTEAERRAVYGDR